ncbi:MAG: hypothetical protein LBD46_06525 [Endomicrobium sp.]|jgi:hypothetical protein|nr:hypothetical protein [Endomicrobium sp.]
MKILEMFECDDTNDKRISFGRVWTAIMLLIASGLAFYSVERFDNEHANYQIFIALAIIAFIAIIPYLITKWTMVKEIIAVARGKNE